MKNTTLLIISLFWYSNTFSQKPKPHPSSSRLKEKGHVKSNVSKHPATGKTSTIAPSNHSNTASQAMKLKMEKEAANKNKQTKPNTKQYDFGPNKTPRYVRVTEARPGDGAKSVVYGDKLRQNGKIAKPSGHGVMKDGKLVYSRGIKDPKAKPRYDAKESKKKKTGPK